jgi:predicted nucleic acid-binding Zn ribbon protein
MDDDTIRLTREQRLAAALIADRNRIKVERTDITKCFVCGTGMMYRGDRFCSDRCRDFYDTGAPGFDQDWLQARIIYRDRAGARMKMGSKAFVIRCPHCRKDFDRKGLRCCSTECERKHRERQDNLAAMAEVGMTPAPAKRTCAECGERIPTWRKGRRVPSSTRFCSPRCSARNRNRTQVPETRI